MIYVQVNQNMQYIQLLLLLNAFKDALLIVFVQFSWTATTLIYVQS